MMNQNQTRERTGRIAIIGGGISGLATAFYLQQQSPQAELVLYEASDRLGGVIRTERHDGALIEFGPDNFATLIPDALELSRAAGLADELIPPNAEHRMARVVAKGKLYPIPAGFSLIQPTQWLSILTTPILSWRGRLRLLGEYFVRPRIEDTDESLKSFAVRRLGQEAYDRLVEPIVGGIFTADGETLSMRGAMPQFFEMERRDGGLMRGYLAKSRQRSASVRAAERASGARYDQFLAPKRGMGTWIQGIAGCLPPASIHFQTPVRNLHRLDDGRWRLKVAPSEDAGAPARSDNDLAEHDFDAVVVALPAQPAAKLLQEVEASVADELAQIPYADSAVAVMRVARSEIDPRDLCFGIVVPKIEGLDILAISFTSEKYPGRIPHDEVLLRVFMGGAVRPELMRESDDELFARAWKETSRLLKLKQPPRWHHVVRWNKAMPQYLVGHETRIERIEQRLATVPNLALAGNALRGVGIPQCIRSARAAATKIGQWFMTRA